MSDSSSSSDAPLPPGSNAHDVAEKQLLQLLRQGDAKAFEWLVRSCGGRMLAVARRMLGHEQDAQDVVQEAFVSALKALPQFAGQSKLATWLHRIVVNAALMRLRSQKRNTDSRLIDDLLPKFLEDGHQANPAVDWRDPADIVLQRLESRALVRECIQQLPEIYRTILILRDIEELDTEESAQLLGVTSAVVKTRLHRARLALRTLLDPHFRGDDA